MIQATEIPAQELKRALQSMSLIKGRNVLRKEPISKEVAEDDQFFYNDKFTSKLVKVKISTVAATKVGWGVHHRKGMAVSRSR